MTTRERAVAGLAVAGALVSAASCQGYEFHPAGSTALAAGTTTIQIKGRPLPPNIMLVVDKSGSMTSSATGTGQGCTTDGTVGATYSAASANSCKWNDLKTTIADPTTGLLATSKSLGRFGLVAFPAATARCDPGSVLVPIGDDVAPIQDQLNNHLAPGGGTPTAATLLAAAKDPALANPEPNRKHFVMLLTDGVPNCSPANAAKCAQCRADVTTCDQPGGCLPTEVPETCPTDPFDGATCLDEDGLVSAVTQLESEGIGTFVIGFGKDTTGSDANRVLTRAAVAGGYPRQGAAQQFYQANSVTELRTYLQEILEKFPCTFQLSTALGDAPMVEVSVTDSQTGTENSLIEGTDWQFPSPTVSDQVQILGDWCTNIQTAASDRYVVQVRYVKAL